MITHSNKIELLLVKTQVKFYLCSLGGGLTWSKIYKK